MQVVIGTVMLYLSINVQRLMDDVRPCVVVPTV